MAAQHRNATVAAVRMAGQTADIRRDLTALRPMGDRVEAVGVEAAVLRIADPAVEAAVGIAVGAVAVRAAEVVAVRVAEAVVVRVAEAVVVLRMRLRHMVAAESLTGKIAGASSSLAFRPQEATQ